MLISIGYLTSIGIVIVEKTVHFRSPLACFPSSLEIRSKWCRHPVRFSVFKVVPVASASLLGGRRSDRCFNGLSGGNIYFTVTVFSCFWNYESSSSRLPPNQRIVSATCLRSSLKGLAAVSSCICAQLPAALLTVLRRSALSAIYGVSVTTKSSLPQQLSPRYVLAGDLIRSLFVGRGTGALQSMRHQKLPNQIRQWPNPLFFTLWSLQMNFHKVPFLLMTPF